MIYKWSPEEITSLVQLSSFINSSLDITKVMDNSLQVLEDFIDAEVSSIFEVDHEKQELFFKLARGKAGNTLKGIRMKMGEGIAGLTASSGKPLIIHDVEKDSRFSHIVDSLTNYRTKSIIAAPIKNKGRVIGVAEVINKRGPEPFNTKDLEIMTIVANQLGIAMENARLYSDLNDKFCFTQSELKKSQAELVRSERLAAMGQLVYGIAHAVRNPVMSIGGFTRRLKKKMSTDNASTQYLNMIIEETERLEKMVKDVHKLTSMPRPDLRQIRISDLIEQLIENKNKQFFPKNINIEYKLPENDAEVSVDDHLISDAIIRILQNAVEAMDSGGDIHISILRESKWIIISIRDTGPGIAPEDLPLVFDPFFTKKTHGSGLGLTTANQIIKEHNGEVEILSVSGKGTEVKVYLPPYSPEK